MIRHLLILLFYAIAAFQCVFGENAFEEASPPIALDDPCNQTEQPEIALSDDYLLATYLEYLAGGGVGYDQSYATVGALYFPPTYMDFCCFSQVQPFLDLRIHLMKNSLSAFNLGAGTRIFCNTFNRVFGANIYYDYRHTRKCYHQLGVGFEMLSGCDDFFDMRLNLYLPIGNKTESCCPHTFRYPGGYFAIATKKQRVLRGIDFEIETWLSRFTDCCCNCDFNIAAGWYYLHGKCVHNVLGGKARIGFDYCDMIRLEGRIYYDTLFKTNAQALISFVYYFGGDSSCCCNNDCCDCDCQCFLRQRVMRQEIIVQDKKRCFFKTNF